MRINTFGWVAAVKVTCHTMVQVQGGTHIGLVVVEYIEFYPAYRILYGQRSWMVNGFKMRWMLIDGHLMAADCLYLTFLRYECWGKILTPWNMWHALVRELFIFCILHSLIGTIYLQIISFFFHIFSWICHFRYKVMPPASLPRSTDSILDTLKLCQSFFQGRILKNLQRCIDRHESATNQLQI